MAGLSLLSTRILRLTLPLPSAEGCEGVSFSGSSAQAEGQEREDHATAIANAAEHAGALLCSANGRVQEKALHGLPQTIEFVARPRSMYILSGVCRYAYAHAVLGVNSTELILDQSFEIDRRMSLITRDELVTS